MRILPTNLRPGLITGSPAKKTADPKTIKRGAFWHDRITALFAPQHVPSGPQILGMPKLPSFFGGKK